MTKPKVSVVTPCYNGENFLDAFFSSILNQDYEGEIEFILIDDGSTDNTKEKFEQYKYEFAKRNWTARYIYKENGGQSSAINIALKLITGDYLIWPDCDDIMYPNNISEKVKYMEENPSFGMAYCIIDVVDESDKSTIIRQLKKIPGKNQFKNILQNKSWMYVPIGVIVRTTALFDVNPEKEIYTGVRSQNCQMQLPIAFSYPVGFIDKSLGKYVVRENSSCRSADKKYIKRQFQFVKIWINTIFRLKYAKFGRKLEWSIKFIVMTLGNIYKYIKTAKS